MILKKKKNNNPKKPSKRQNLNSNVHTYRGSVSGFRPFQKWMFSHLIVYLSFNYSYPCNALIFVRSKDKCRYLYSFRIATPPRRSSDKIRISLSIRNDIIILILVLMCVDNSIINNICPGNEFQVWWTWFQLNAIRCFNTYILVKLMRNHISRCCWLHVVYDTRYIKHIY